MAAAKDTMETREMRLITKVIQLSDAVEDQSLPQFIAARRAPGEGWKTWDEITIALHAVIGEVVTDVSLKRWASRYGIPEHTRQDGNGEVKAAEYAKALRKAGISI